MDLLNQIQLEHFPGQLNEKNKMISQDWVSNDWINFTFQLYVNYISILKKVEDAYDQTIQPQLRKVMKKFLENTAARLVQVKKELIFYSNPITALPALPYVFLDDQLIDMKLEVEDIRVPIPRIFAEAFTNEQREREITLVL